MGSLLGPWRINPGDLPTWRKLLMACLVGIWLFLGSSHLFKELDIYSSAPQTPVVETRQSYPVRVNHGYLRYVTKKEAEDWAFASTTTGPIIGVLAVTMLLLLATSGNMRSS